MRCHQNFRWRENGDSREDELAFAVGPCAEEVDDHDDDETHRYPCRIVDRLVPEVNQDRGGAEFGGQNDRPVVPVVPALQSRGWLSAQAGGGGARDTHHSEGESRVDEACSQRDVATRDGKVRDHFPDRDHDGVRDGPNYSITQKKSHWTCILERASSS